MIGWIIWGSGGDSVDLGVAEHRYCEVCERERPFKIILQYRYAHLYWLFSWITKKNYLLLCDICHRGWNLKATEVEKTLSQNPIPFMRRWGWIFLASLVLIPLLIVVVGSILTS
jgi:hypothetical protein